MIIEILTRYQPRVSGLDSDLAAPFWARGLPLLRTGDSCGWRSARGLNVTRHMICFLLTSIHAIVLLTVDYDAVSLSNIFIPKGGAERFSALPDLFAREHQ